eukprot:8156411-Lingulodinium_polyedra.AAC.1
MLAHSGARGFAKKVTGESAKADAGKGAEADDGEGCPKCQDAGCMCHTAGTETACWEVDRGSPASCKQAFLHPALLRASSTSCAGIAGIIFGQAWQSALHCTRSLTTSSTLADRIAGDALSSCVGGITIPRTYSIWPLC